MKAEKTTSEKLHSLHSSAYIIKVISSGRMAWTEHAARMEHIRSALILARKREADREFGRHKQIWNDNIKINLK
jgi:hypothetical protein